MWDSHSIENKDIVFIGTHCLAAYMVTNTFEDHNDSISTLKMEAVNFSEMLVRPTKVHGIKATVIIQF
jgi:hypothetical protein